MKKKVTRKENRERLVNLRLGTGQRYTPFFPDLMARLRDIADPRHQSYITYSSSVVLMTSIVLV